MDVPSKLFRNTELKYAKAFVEEGEIMFRPLSYYQRLEDEKRRDEFEGMYLRNMAGAKLSVDWDNTGEYIHVLNVDSGRIVFDNHNADQIHVSCFSLQPQPKFGPSVVEIFRPKEFFDYLFEGLKLENIKLEYGSIQYYDDAERLSGLPPNQLWLFKRKKFELEKEFRISFFVPNREVMYQKSLGKTPPIENGLVAPRIKLCVGPLHDFSRLA